MAIAAKRLRRRLSYATVVSALTAFVLLAGGAAYAGSQLAKNSVGSKQLKKNSVTTAKLKKNAVTTAKIKSNAVNGTKVKDGSLTGANFNAAASSFLHIVHEARGTGSVALGVGLTPVPLDNATYTQPAGRDDFFAGRVEVTFAAGCEGDRFATALLLADSVRPDDPNTQEVVALGMVADEATGTTSRKINLGGSEIGAVRFQPTVATNHTLALIVAGSCGTGNGISAANAAVDVLGVG